jgi:acetylornithine deacetylase
MKELDVKKILPMTRDFLKAIIRIPSTSGKEEQAIQLIYNRIVRLVDEIELVPLDNNLKSDPDYSSPIEHIDYSGRHNLRAVLKGNGAGKSILFNTHVDVVPPSALQERAFDPFEKDGLLYGRGACDAKGQIATLFLLLSLIQKSKLKFSGDIIFHFVVEEENGGNGTLAAIRRGEQADAAIVMEPTGMKILPYVRGAVWFRLTCVGKPGHSGSGGRRISALDLAIEAMSILRDYHDHLLAASKGIPLFDDFVDPMPITFGKCHAGDWPATIPNKAIVEGVLGFLPNKTKEQVMQEIKDAIQEIGSEDLKSNFQIDYVYRHDCHTLSPDHNLVKSLADACLKTGMQPAISAMAASCDSWFYQNQLKIPTVVFGPGDLAVAHSNHEHIAMAQIKQAAQILFEFISNWCQA